MIDSHCHIAGPEFASDLDAVIERAGAAGVERALVILAAEDDEETARARLVRGGLRRGFQLVCTPMPRLFEQDPQAAATTGFTRD